MCRSSVLERCSFWACPLSCYEYIFLFFCFCYGRNWRMASMGTTGLSSVFCFSYFGYLCACPADRLLRWCFLQESSLQVGRHWPSVHRITNQLKVPGRPRPRPSKSDQSSPTLLQQLNLETDGKGQRRKRPGNRRSETSGAEEDATTLTH